MALGAQLNQRLGQQTTAVILGEQATLSAAGTNQASATAITVAAAIVTVCAAGAGVVLPLGGTSDRIHVANNTANTLACYPPNGGKLGTASANVPAQIAPGKAADFYCVDGTNYTAILSA